MVNGFVLKYSRYVSAPGTFPSANHIKAAVAFRKDIFPKTTNVDALIFGQSFLIRLLMLAFLVSALLFQRVYSSSPA